MQCSRDPSHAAAVFCEECGSTFCRECAAFVHSAPTARNHTRTQISLLFGPRSAPSSHSAPSPAVSAALQRTVDTQPQPRVSSRPSLASARPPPPVAPAPRSITPPSRAAPAGTHPGSGIAGAAASRCTSLLPCCDGCLSMCCYRELIVYCVTRTHSGARKRVGGGAAAGRRVSRYTRACDPAHARCDGRGRRHRR